jgi:hypothetical protein
MNEGNDNHNFTFSSSYFFAIPNSQSTFTLQFNLWQNETLTAAPPRATVTVTGQVKAGAWANATGSIFATAQVVPLNRLPVILVNKTGEIENLPGYGYRYVGEQRFYAFDLGMGTDLPSGADPWIFRPGLKGVPASRASSLESKALLRAQQHGHISDA